MDYNTLVSNIRNKKDPILFNPEYLDSLEENQRRKIEFEIMLNILDGNKLFFKYIPYMEKFDICQHVYEEDIKQFLEPTTIYELEKNIYKKTHEIEVLAFTLNAYKNKPDDELLQSLFEELYNYNVANNREMENEILLTQLSFISNKTRTLTNE